MITTCPKCNTPLELPDGSEGAQGRCPACEEVFTISAPVVQAKVVRARKAGGGTQTAVLDAPPATAAPAPTAPAPPTAPKPSPAGSLADVRVGGQPLVKLIALGGAMLMAVSFFMPWWGASIKYRPIQTAEDREKLQAEAQEFRKIGEKTEKFYDAVLSKSQQADAEKVVKLARDNKPAHWAGIVFGWGFGRGIVTLIFGWLAAGLIVPPLYVKLLRKWDWTMLYPAAGMGLAAFIFGLTVWVGTPGAELPGRFLSLSQGISAGPILALIGGVMLMGAAGLSATLGLLRFVRSLAR